MIFVHLNLLCDSFFHNTSSKILQILFELLAKGGTVKGLIEEKDLVQASSSICCTSLFRENHCKIYHVVLEYNAVHAWQLKPK